MPLEYRYLGLREDPPALIDYTEAWDLQRAIHAEVVAGADPVCLMLEHGSVYTAGRRTQPEHRPKDGTPVIDVDRGGLITWHGPGQLVGYPIVRLPETVGVVDYIRRVEEAVISYLAELGLATGRVKGRAGVWLAADGGRPERKIAQIGVRVARKTSMHGFSLNVRNDLDWTQTIVPCGITDAGVTTLALELGDAPTVLEAAEGMARHLDLMLSWQPFELSPDIRAEEVPLPIGRG
jgi:lipoyl(octanoyl) transferase